MFERESRREKILEARMREIRLKGRVKPSDTGDTSQQEVIEKIDECKVAENEYFAAIEEVKILYCDAQLKKT